MLKFTKDEMIKAMLSSDSHYEGLFYTAVKTTGIFCRPTCKARKPKPENVEFFSTADEALVAGYRPCLRCNPLNIADNTPAWIKSLLQQITADNETKWTDERLIIQGIDPVNLRRWFKKQLGMTFHSYLRSYRLGLALKQLTSGQTIDNTAMDIGYESISGFREALQKNFGVLPTSINKKLLTFGRITTPFGPMIAMIEEKGLVLLEFIDRPALIKEINQLQTRYNYIVAPGTSPLLQQIQEELTLYFMGKLTTFTIPIQMKGNNFDMIVWQELLKIPYGTTCNYADIAYRIDKPKAYRAVGTANGNNTIAIIIPCHRVIGSNGKLVGYGGGQARKAALLKLEQQSQLSLNCL